MWRAVFRCPAVDDPLDRSTRGRICNVHGFERRGLHSEGVGVIFKRWPIVFTATLFGAAWWLSTLGGRLPARVVVGSATSPRRRLAPSVPEPYGAYRCLLPRSLQPDNGGSQPLARTERRAEFFSLRILLRASLAECSTVSSSTARLVRRRDEGSVGIGVDARCRRLSRVNHRHVLVLVCSAIRVAFGARLLFDGPYAHSVEGDESPTAIRSISFSISP